ncbi:hypothetical protein CB0940_00158 [Cercospora beticola]|uniref:Extensin domain-containing protein n=1 Tax=Cercospora beticola TaxID=122368 RepID=A0A2G5ICH0_CERBT|nr:hypothetical protein CB0940_00158 [Cercospora beticola]PIB02461.1 hypothetical protein CB0940_00158 [Cercospora beticola]WPA95560.1 hypothetical protein RHO25_000161 [Cercospora beticola]
MDHSDSKRPSMPPNATAGMDHAEELLAEVDEPPDERKAHTTWAPPKLPAYPTFNKADPRMYQRRESLLTRQLHSEAEQTDDDAVSQHPPRTLSTQSTWSNPSNASTAELTSDDGHSVASPFHSPPLPPTIITTHVPAVAKAMTKGLNIAEQDSKVADTGSEQSVEASLGRKRCISFACGGNKNKNPPTSQPQPQPAAPPSEPTVPSSPPKRKCALKFVCPTRAAAEAKPVVEKQPTIKRLASPPPPERRNRISSPKAHRGSDSTVTHASPMSVRKSSVILETAAVPATSGAMPKLTRKFSDDSDRSTEATRFHEFASSDDEPEEWVQESTCYKSRLTVNDTLQKEITIRKACEEVEEEVLEEEDAEDDDDVIDEDEDDEEDEDDVIELEEESDEGFRTDDEEGFAESDSEGEDSDDDWWRPGGASTAATSTDHLDHLAKSALNSEPLASSIGSLSSSHISPRTLLRKPRKIPANAVPISQRAPAIDLPDSTDFVCGTLDEDRPLEQAYLLNKKQREAAKHKARPQDIDPTFPTSDPEMDEEDDEDLINPEESDHESLMHGTIEDLDDEATLRRRMSKRGGRPSHVHRSPPPPARHRSPAPGAMKRTNTARSPPPPVRRGTARSPPPTSRRGTTHSPPPRRLFANSPKRSRSPAPAMNKVTSPPNTRRISPSSFGLAANKSQANVLASRPQLTHTASLPRNGGYTLGKFNGYRKDEGEETETGSHIHAADHHKRGAIDIYKGLERKRQRRKEKLHAKMCAKAAAKGEKVYKVKPGKGAERMREVGLELQRYRGKGEHILSM